MAGPLKLTSWEQVGILLLLVFVAGMSEASPTWRHWAAPILYACLGALFLVLAYKFLRP